MTMCLVCAGELPCKFGHSQETLAQRQAKLIMDVSPASVSGVAPVSPSPGIPSPAAGERRGSTWECKVCAATPDAEGWVEHGKGCYQLSSDGGGGETVEFPTVERLGLSGCAHDNCHFAGAIPCPEFIRGKAAEKLERRGRPDAREVVIDLVTAKLARWHRVSGHRELAADIVDAIWTFES